MPTENNEDPVNAPDLSRLSALIYVFGINKDIWRRVDKYFACETEEQDCVVDLGLILDSFAIKESGWNVLAHRFGFEQRLTLDVLAEHLGVTKARVQQIEQSAFKKLHGGVRDVALALLPLENAVKQSWRALRQVAFVDEAVVVLQSLYEEAENDSYNLTISRLLLALRALMQNGSSTATKHLPHLTYLACSLSPAFTKHPRVAQEEGERERQQWEETHRWSYRELAEFVLQEAGKPLHYIEIAERAEAMGKRDSVTLTGIHNVLLSDTDKFAHVDQGTYGLRAWGLTSVDAYTNIIADALKEAGKTLTYGDLLHRVNSVRPVKPQTFQMTLDMHPRFYQSKQEGYGLRAWLPPREKQTLRTPDSLVETSASYERVKRATERNYDVFMIVAQDKLPDGQS